MLLTRRDSDEQVVVHWMLLGGFLSKLRLEHGLVFLPLNFPDSVRFSCASSSCSFRALAVGSLGSVFTFLLSGAELLRAFRRE